MKPILILNLAIACALPLMAAESDPAKTPPPPVGSIGFADRSPSLDVLPGFKTPPPGFGTVPFFWWLGDPLTKERLAWQLEQMEGMVLRMGKDGKVTPETVDWSLNPMHPMSGQWYAESFFGQFEKHFAEGTKLRLPLTNKEMQVIVFSPGAAVVSTPSTIQSPPSIIPLDEEWDFELKPTLDNRFGDFHWPPTNAMIGAEARRMKYADEVSPNSRWKEPDFDDSQWQQATCGYGPRFWKLGPLPETADADAQLAELRKIDPSTPVRINGSEIHQCYRRTSVQSNGARPRKRGVLCGTPRQRTARRRQDHTAMDI